MALKWTIAGGTLPPGTTLNPNGAIQSGKGKTVFDYSNYGTGDWVSKVYIEHFEINLTPEGKDIFAEARMWCEERFGLGLNITFDDPTEDDVAAWAYDLIGLFIKFREPNHAFEFRMRWC